jgi:hypothetical protein
MSKLTFGVEIKEVEQINPLFSKCKVYICYSDLNRNNSVISKELINEKIDTLKNCPIVGQFNKNKDDFTDHGGAVEQDKSGEWKYVVTTVPYGVVPESSDIKWEYINGKDYLTCTGFLWTSRYPEAQKVIDEGRPQSMEIEAVQGSYNNKKEFMVSDFVFSALTILGEDVEPCFEDAKIVGYAFSKEEFQQSFVQMVEELKFSLKYNENGNNHKDAPIDNKFIQKEDEVVTKKKSEIAAQFSLTVNQLYDEMSRALSEIKYETTNWYGEEVEVSRFYLRDFDDQFAYAVDRQNDYIDVKIPYSMNGDNVSFSVDEVKRIKYVPTDWEDQTTEEGAETNFSLHLVEEGKKMFDRVVSEKDEISKDLVSKDDAWLALNEQYTSLQSQFTEKEKEIEGLVAFKQEIEKKTRKEKVDSLFSKYAANLTKDEIEDLRGREHTFAIVDDFEKEIKSIVCDKLVESVKNGTAAFNKMGIPPQETNVVEPTNVWERLDNKNKNNN